MKGRFEALPPTGCSSAGECRPWEPEAGGSSPPAPTISEAGLIETIREIDPDLAHMIESLSPVYLVKG
jgi:hypothetical protein